MTAEINFDMPDDDFLIVEEIVDRALKMAARLHAATWTAPPTS